LGGPACGAGGARAARTHPVVQIVVHGASKSSGEALLLRSQAYRTGGKKLRAAAATRLALAPSSVIPRSAAQHIPRAERSISASQSL